MTYEDVDNVEFEALVNDFKECCGYSDCDARKAAAAAIEQDQ